MIESTKRTVLLPYVNIGLLAKKVFFNKQMDMTTL